MDTRSAFAPNTARPRPSTPWNSSVDFSYTSYPADSSKYATTVLSPPETSTPSLRPPDVVWRASTTPPYPRHPCQKSRRLGASSSSRSPASICWSVRPAAADRSRGVLLTTAPPTLDHPIHHDPASPPLALAARVARRADVCPWPFDQNNSASPLASASTSSTQLLPRLAPPDHMAML